MRPEDITKIKWNLPKKRKASTPEGASKNSVTSRGKAMDKCGFAIEATVILVTPTPPSLTPLALAPISVVAPMPASPPPMVSLLAAPMPPHGILSSSTQLPTTVGASSMPPPSNKMDLDTRFDSILEDATFDDWRVIKKLTKRLILPIELKGIVDMGFDDLQQYSMTAMHQVPSLSLVSFFDFSFHLSANYSPSTYIIF